MTNIKTASHSDVEFLLKAMVLNECFPDKSISTSPTGNLLDMQIPGRARQSLLIDTPSAQRYVQLNCECDLIWKKSLCGCLKVGVR